MGTDLRSATCTLQRGATVTFLGRARVLRTGSESSALGISTTRTKTDPNNTEETLLTVTTSSKVREAILTSEARAE